MLRVTVGLGFNRAKLAAMHAVLRGHAASDTGTGPIDQTAINEQFSIMSKAQDAVLSLNNWTAFQKCLLAAGYVFVLSAAIAAGPFLLSQLGARGNGPF
jgi:hypothetical protein